jgi:hypothetical protein
MIYDFSTTEIVTYRTHINETVSRFRFKKKQLNKREQTYEKKRC